ncbi:MFS transporter [Microbacter margulisiae]|uniref:Dipeptide/tripeptide permease n=1 Tax=Microbacter margulisiae TaxID=1350067 RepID=A0A7W5DP23_9PORP|nr:MFS transporter [Microbacter margulisiae]MBB3186316.1 dipeptide/tripeptide permease [Microbacter margulisiae]
MSKISKALKKFPGVFWIANTMELLERWAWYGLFAVLALYLTQSTDTGALGFSQTQKGDIMGIVTAILYLLPIVTGAIADRFGYKKVLILAYIVLSTGYFMMGQFTTYGYVFFAFLYVALGAAMFKPIVSATVAKTTDEETSSIGFGIFYMMVNIGGFLGPIVSSKMRVVAWDHVFTMSTISILLNLVLVLLFYKEPKRETEVEAKKYLILDYLNILWTLITSIIIFVVFFTIFLTIFVAESLVIFLLKERVSFKFVDFINTLPIGDDNKKIFRNITTIFRDSKFILFLVFIVGFWTMFNQIFYTLPNFIDQWVNTQSLYDFFGHIWSGLSWFFGPDDGRRVIEPEIVVSFDAGFIILFQILISSFVMRMRPINSMISGIIVSAIGVALAFATHSVAFVVLGIFIFSIGEMASSPKFTEYIGIIAPREKVGMYMGYSFLPVAIGNFFAGILSGRVYQSMSDKISLLQIDAARRGLHIPAISKTTDFTQNDYINRFCKLTGMSHDQVTEYLWQHYHPANIWIIFALIGFVAVAGLWIYDRYILGTARKR